MFCLTQKQLQQQRHQPPLLLLPPHQVSIFAPLYPPPEKEVNISSTKIGLFCIALKRSLSDKGRHTYYIIFCGLVVSSVNYSPSSVSITSPLHALLMCDFEENKIIPFFYVSIIPPFHNMCDFWAVEKLFSFFFPFLF